MKIAISAGHSLSGLGSGAVGVVNESVEVRKIGKKVADLLKSNGQEVLYLQVDKADSYKGENYKTRVKQANNLGADLFVEIHLNCGGGHGAEVYTYGGKEFSEAKQILHNICSLGYRNRGIKNGNSLYVINNTKMKSCLVECFFCDSKSDVNLYNADTMAKAIAEGILGKKISGDNVKNNITSNFRELKYVIPCMYNEDVKQLQTVLKKLKYLKGNADGIFGANTQNAVLAYQKEHKFLNQRAIVDKKTWDSIMVHK